MRASDRLQALARSEQGIVLLGKLGTLMTADSVNYRQCLRRAYCSTPGGMDLTR